MSTNTVPAVPVPPGFSADDWARNEPRPWRLIWGPQHKIGAAVVRLSAAQYFDGSIDKSDADGPAIHIDVCQDWGINAKHARDVATAILVAADEADRLKG